MPSVLPSAVPHEFHIIGRIIMIFRCSNSIISVSGNLIRVSRFPNTFRYYHRNCIESHLLSRNWTWTKLIFRQTKDNTKENIIGRIVKFLFDESRHKVFIHFRVRFPTASVASHLSDDFVCLLLYFSGYCSEAQNNMRTLFPESAMWLLIEGWWSGVVLKDSNRELMGRLILWGSGKFEGE